LLSAGLHTFWTAIPPILLANGLPELIAIAIRLTLRQYTASILNIYMGRCRGITLRLSTCTRWMKKASYLALQHAQIAYLVRDFSSKRGQGRRSRMAQENGLLSWLVCAQMGQVCRQVSVRSQAKDSCKRLDLCWPQWVHFGSQEHHRTSWNSMKSHGTS
jgi:hypothetical protein